MYIPFLGCNNKAVYMYVPFLGRFICTFHSWVEITKPYICIFSTLGSLHMYIFHSWVAITMPYAPFLGRCIYVYNLCSIIGSQYMYVLFLGCNKYIICMFHSWVVQFHGWRLLYSTQMKLKKSTYTPKIRFFQPGLFVCEFKF